MPNLRIAYAILTCASVAAPQMLSAACPNFDAPAILAAGSNPRGIAVADFDGDGNLDYATANSLSNNVTVRLGNGAGGGFGTLTPFAAGTGASGIVAGDFNRDGRPDLVTTNHNTNTISILLGDGAGGFAAPVTHVVGSGPWAVAAGDVNNDGKLDLAITFLGAGTVGVFLGAGDGSFAASASALTGSSPHHVAIVDVSGDGRRDVVTVNSGSNTVSVSLGFGNGTFATKVDYAVGTEPTEIASGDFDRDGDVDLAVSKYSFSTSVLLNNGDGTFATYAQSGSNGDSIHAADFDGDGILDLALARNGAVTIAIGDGLGAFAGSGPEFPMGDYLEYGMAAGDFDGDGRIDLAAASWYNNDVRVVLNASRCAANCATFTTDVTPAGSSPIAVASGDFDRDGFPDLVVANNTGTMSLLLGDAGGFAVPASFTTGAGSFAIAVADFNKDSKLDAVVSNPQAAGFTVLAGNGAGLFSFLNVSDGAAIYSVAVADFNRDNNPDLVFADPNNGGISVYLHTGGAGVGFAGPTRIAMGGAPFFATAADLDLDGKPDIVSANAGTDDVTVRLGEGLGGFGSPSSYAAGDGPRFIAVADFDGDGLPDLAVANENDGTLSILLGTGGGAFAAPVHYPLVAGLRSIAVGDLDLDGRLDLAVTNMTTSTVTVLSGGPNGTFATKDVYGTGTSPASVTTGDFDRDGKPDLATANINSNNVFLFTNTCLAPELDVVKTHTGDFTQGEIGVQYTITVSNSGNAATSGTVTVTDALPAGLVATALAGTGWTCVLPTLKCTRSDALAISASYPPITVTADVRSNAPALVTNVASVAVGIELDPDDNAAEDPTTIVANPNAAPTFLSATAASTSQVNLTWDGVSGVTAYQVSRTANGTTTTLATPSATTFTDLAVTGGNSYVYHVRAWDASTSTLGAPSNRDIATTIFFTDPVPTLVKAIHFTEMRTAVQAVRAAAGLTPFSFTGGIVPGAIISATHLTELRTALDQALTQLDMIPGGYTDTIVAEATRIKAVHLVELRNTVK